VTCLRRAFATGVATFLLVPVAACSDDGADGPSDVSVGPGQDATTAADCEAMVPAEAIDALGWTGDEGAASDVMGCQRRAAQGYLQVRRTSVSGDVQQEFDDRCAALDLVDEDDPDGEAGPGQVVTWLDDRTACAIEPDEDVGLTKVLLMDDDGLTQVWVIALETTAQERVRDAVSLLAEQA
jgi:hypothetical protein